MSVNRPSIVFVDNAVNRIFKTIDALKTSYENIQRAKKYSEVKALVGIDPEALIPDSELYKKVDNVDVWIEQEVGTLDKLIIGLVEL